jgi:hypothetical protein
METSLTTLELEKKLVDMEDQCNDLLHPFTNIHRFPLEFSANVLYQVYVKGEKNESILSAFYTEIHKCGHSNTNVYIMPIFAPHEGWDRVNTDFRTGHYRYRESEELYWCFAVIRRVERVIEFYNILGKPWIVDFWKPFLIRYLIEQHDDPIRISFPEQAQCVETDWKTCANTKRLMATTEPFVHTHFYNLLVYRQLLLGKTFSEIMRCSIYMNETYIMAEYGGKKPQLVK